MEAAVSQMAEVNKLMAGVAAWCAYYRANPARFVKDYLHINLKLFQKILITMMLRSTVFVFIATRGIGKTYLSAIYSVVRCILYPGTKVCIASGTRGQAINVLEKIILELKPNSPELAAEIDEKESKINGTNAVIVFKNGSYIKVVTASDTSRGNRANVLLLDEFRLISKDIVDTILRKFLTQRRMPRYAELTPEERQKEYEKEKNITMYLSSAWWQDSWAFLKCRDAFKFMLDDTKRQFVCGFPYQLSIIEGLLDPELVADEMAETDFSEIKFQMEYCAEFYGSADGAFFEFDSISKNRRIKYPMLPERLASKVQGSALQIPPKQSGEYRILSSDIALMSSRRHNNDATALTLNQMVPTKAGRYMHNITYIDSAEGMRTEDQALMIRKLFDEFDCDYLVLDTNGVGLGVYDCLARDILDPETGELYPALSCYNDTSMAERCAVTGAPKVIWSIKANAQLNNDCAILLRDGFRNGRIRLLLNEYDAETELGALRGFSGLNPQERLKLELPYINTTLLIDELVNLQHDESNGKVRIYEKAGRRKDRYSSLAYNYYVATQLEAKAARKSSMAIGEEIFQIRAPKTGYGRTVKSNGRSGAPRWSR